VLASIYGLHNGADLYKKQKAEIERIEQRVVEQRQKIIDEHYEKGELVPENRPWIDYSTPFWAIWYSSPYHFKKPSPAMVYSIGQSEQYGFYKRITFWASPYDADLVEEIANPERLQTGSLDFSFALLFLMPLVLLVLLYNVKSFETEQGFLLLIEVQNPSKNTWLLSRISFYTLLLFLVITGLLIYGALLTHVFEQAGKTFGQMLLYVFAYLLFWSILYFFILVRSKSILGNTLKMSAIYLLFAFIVPATVHQVLSIKHPANMMTDFIDVRDEQQELFDEPDSVYQARLITLFPEIVKSPIYVDSIGIDVAMNRSASALVNELKKASIEPIEKEKQVKNGFIKSTFWFNPVSFFQNRFNAIAQSHYNDYQNYRNEVQLLIDKQIRSMVLDTWYEVEVDQKKFGEYQNLFVQ
jgi:ABC-2 type transport system permease protein